MQTRYIGKAVFSVGITVCCCVVVLGVVFFSPPPKPKEYIKSAQADKENAASNASDNVLKCTNIMVLSPRNNNQAILP